MAKPANETTELSFTCDGSNIVGSHVKRLRQAPGSTEFDAAVAWIEAERPNSSFREKLELRESSTIILAEAIWRRKATAASTDLRQVLAWVAARAGASGLSTSIAALPTTLVGWDADHRLFASVVQLRSGDFLTRVVVNDNVGLEVYPTREEYAVSSTFAGALAQIASDLGESALATAIAAI